MGFSLLGPRKAQLVAQYMKPIFGRLRLERRGIHPTQPSLQGNDFFVAINRTPSKPSCKSGTKAQVQTPTLNMQSIRDSILRYVRVRRNNEPWFFAGSGNVLKRLSRQMRASSGTGPDQIMDRVIGLVKKFDKIDADKVTETADFQKDLSLDSLDRVELVMAFEAEFSIEIPEEKADKLTCCADVAKYIAEENTVKS